MYDHGVAPSLPHEFSDTKLLRLALTHASCNESKNNERLEFLGDAVLDLVVADELYREGANLSEGAMTELKASIVSRQGLAQAARQLDLEAEAKVGAGLRRGTLPASVLANLYEAIVGAVYLDAGFEAARDFCLATLGPKLARLHEHERATNPKQELQELCQARWGEPPSYEVLDERGRAHSRAFLVRAIVRDEPYPGAWGRTRKEAERWAAHEALLRLE